MEKKYRIESFASNFEDFCFPWNFEIETYKLEILQNNRVDVKKPKLKFSRKIFLNFNDFYFYNIDTIICRFIAREKLIIFIDFRKYIRLTIIRYFIVKKYSTRISTRNTAWMVIFINKGRTERGKIRNTCMNFTMRNEQPGVPCQTRLLHVSLCIVTSVYVPIYVYAIVECALNNS